MRQWFGFLVSLAILAPTLSSAKTDNATAPVRPRPDVVLTVAEHTATNGIGRAIWFERDRKAELHLISYQLAAFPDCSGTVSPPVAAEIFTLASSLKPFTTGSRLTDIVVQGAGSFQGAVVPEGRLAELFRLAVEPCQVPASEPRPSSDIRWTITEEFIDSPSYLPGGRYRISVDSTGAAFVSSPLFSLDYDGVSRRDFRVSGNDTATLTTLVQRARDFEPEKVIALGTAPSPFPLCSDLDDELTVTGYEDGAWRIPNALCSTRSFADVDAPARLIASLLHRQVRVELGELRQTGG